MCIRDGFGNCSVSTVVVFLLVSWIVIRHCDDWLIVCYGSSCFFFTFAKFFFGGLVLVCGIKKARLLLSNACGVIVYFSKLCWNVFSGF